MIDNIKRSIKQQNTILFVGSGISATLGLPSWSQLIDHIASDLGYDGQLFKQYGDNLTLAEYYIIQKGHIGELRSWMDQNWSIDSNTIKESLIYKSIVTLNCPLIYTTNYDHCLETAFDVWGKKYKRIVSVEDFVSIPQQTTQIIKLHGDLIRDDSIVLTESSYFDRLNFDSPLDIKLRSDMLGKSILFIGYSLSDINIRILLYKLDELWKKSNNSKRPQSYIFLPKPNPIQEAILNKRGIATIIGEETDRKKSTEKFLLKLLEEE
jgi:hypothetical protein